MTKIEFISAFSFRPHSDMDADRKETAIQHREEIQKKNYSSATNILDENHYNDGFRALLFNSIQDKLRRLEIYILNEFYAEPDELYSLTEPSPAQMGNKKFWIQPYG